MRSPRSASDWAWHAKPILACRFGKLLILRAVPEWRSQYLSYKKLKRILKRIGDDDDEDGERVVAAASAPSVQNGGVFDLMPEDSESGGPSLPTTALSSPLLSSPSLLQSVEADFFALLEEDIRRINAHSATQRQWIEKHVKSLLAESATHAVRASPLTSFYATTAHGGGLRVHDVRRLYCACAKLRSFAAINSDGIRKIVKKFDKTTSLKPPRQKEIVERLAREPFVDADGSAIRALVARLEALCSPDQIMELRRAAQRTLAEPGAERGFWNGHAQSALAIAGALAAATAVHLLPLGTHKVGARGAHDGEDVCHAQRCMAVLVGVVVLWLTEALPYFVTSLLIPVLIVVFNVIPHQAVPSTHPEGLVTRSDLARHVLDAMFDKTIILVLGGLVAASAVARCQVEMRLAVSLQRALGRRPRLFLLALMQLGLLTSLCVSNVTAPILLLSVVQPLLHELPPGSRYARALLLGLAFSCNLGGMLTPIASPQNAVALEALSRVGAEVGFGAWLTISLPIVELASLVIWCLLNVLLLSPCDVDHLPTLDYLPTPLQRSQGLMLLGVLATVIGWTCFSLPPLKDNLGEPALVGLLLTVAAFGSGFLTKADFNGLSWHLLALIAGGNALGLAVSQSGLLAYSADLMMSHLLNHASAWLVAVELALALLVITAFISHTVAAIVVMPIIASIGEQAGEPRGVILTSALAISAAMALPMSSFPNVNSLLAEDDYGSPYLTPKDFLRVGIPASLASGAIVAMLGFPLAVWILEPAS